MVEYLDARLNLLVQAGDLAKELMQELLAIPAAFERARHETLKLKVALALADDWQREGKIASLDLPEGTNVAGLAAGMLTIARAEADRRREVNELAQRIENKTPIDAAPQAVEAERGHAQRLARVAP